MSNVDPSASNWLLVVHLPLIWVLSSVVKLLLFMHSDDESLSCSLICSNILLHMTMLLLMKAGTWRRWLIQRNSLHDKAYSPIRPISTIEVWYDSSSLTLGWEFIQVEPHIMHHCVLLSFFAVTFSTIIFGVLLKLTLIYKLVNECTILWLFRLLPPSTPLFSKKHITWWQLIRFNTWLSPAGEGCTRNLLSQSV